MDKGTHTASTERDAVNAKPEAQLNSLPVNVINERLDQAHATLDLIYTMVVQTDRRQEMIESLCERTLIIAMHSAMLRIQEAKEANNGVNHG
jgi:hypothetical protein